jgi:hypothetical protein
MAQYIQDRARAYGVDPGIALRVAKTEGFYQFPSGIRDRRTGQQERSYGAFQLNDRGLGPIFQRETGLDPSKPENEARTIDWALHYASRHGWGPWMGAAGHGITGFRGIQRQSMNPGMHQHLAMNQAKARTKAHIDRHLQIMKALQDQSGTQNT